jgi:hypothetical protein
MLSKLSASALSMANSEEDLYTPAEGREGWVEGGGGGGSGKRIGR